MRPALLLPGRLALGASLALAGCGIPANGGAEFAQHALVGMPRDTLLSCAGVPQQSIAADGQETDIYVSRSVSVRPNGFDIPMWYGPLWRWPDAYGSDYYSVNRFDCTARVRLENARIHEIGYDPGSTMAQCYAIFAQCLTLVPGPYQRKPG